MAAWGEGERRVAGAGPGVEGTRAVLETDRGGATPEGAGWWYRHRWAMAVAVALVVVAGLGVTALGTFVLAHLTGYYARPRTEKLSDLIKIALTVSGGIGAAVALVVAYRRQRVTEAAHELARTIAHDTRLDASERRITELYVKAADQLGSDKAPVRLAGLYALDRLAQGNPAHRQTVVDVFCAYLRMPHTPLDAPGNGRRWGAAQTPEAGAGDVTPGAADPREERQVRLTAQRLLTDHLAVPAGVDTPERAAALTPSADQRYWPGIRLDLDGAHLEHFSLARGRVARATFDGVTFTGEALFDGVTFTGYASFDRATFTASASFDRATFTARASFDGADFTQGSFVGAMFTGHTAFRVATFTASGSFDGATFGQGAVFGGATFTYASFNGVTFAGTALFDGVTFMENAEFDRAVFATRAMFDSATFTDEAQFIGVRFTEEARFLGATFAADAWFDGATFAGSAWFDGATFAGEVDGLLENDQFEGWSLLSVPERPRVRLLVPPHLAHADGETDGPVALG
jgi:uncharacterized protein YjbI with pentapeptide repeats